MLSLEERKTIARHTMAVVGNKVPVILGAQSTDPVVTMELARTAEEVGAYAIQLSAPYYYGPSDDDVLRLFRQTNNVLKKTGILVYNTPWHGYGIPPRVLEELLSLDRVVAAKWATMEGGIGYMRTLARFSKELAFVDNMHMWPQSFLLGATSFITHFASIWPEHELKVYGLLKSGQYQKAMDEMLTVYWPWIGFQGKMGGRTSGEAPPVRAAMEIVGRPGGPSRPPSRDLTAEERAELREILTKVGAPVA